MPVPSESEGKEPIRSISGQWPESLGGFSGRRNIGLPMRVKGRGRRQDDEVHHEIREEYAGQDIPPRPPEFGVGRAASLLHGPLAGGPVLFDLLGGRAEEQIGRDRCPQDADERGEVIRGLLNTRDQGCGEDSRPVRVSQEGGNDVGNRTSVSRLRIRAICRADANASTTRPTRAVESGSSARRRRRPRG